MYSLCNRQQRKSWILNVFKKYITRFLIRGNMLKQDSLFSNCRNKFHAQKMLRIIVYFILELFQELWYVQYIVSLDYYFNSIAKRVNPKLILRESTKLQSSQHLTYANEDLHIPTVPPTRIHILSQFHKGNILSWCFRWYGRSKN